MKSFSRFLVVVIPMSVIVASCGGGGSDEAENTKPKYNYEKADSLPAGYLEELGIVKSNIEMAAQLFKHMNEKGYSYSESAMLSTGKIFSGSSKQALGIGAIGSDLVYTTSFGQNQNAMNRVKGLFGAASSLGIAEAFDEDLLSKITSDDTTINKSVLLTKAYLNAKDQLFSEERAQYATFMIIGGWIESLHVSCQMIKNDIKDEEIRVGFWQMVNNFGNVRHLCSVFASNSELTALNEKLALLNPVINPIKKNSKKYTAEHVTALADVVAAIRKEQFKI